MFLNYYIFGTLPFYFRVPFKRKCKDFTLKIFQNLTHSASAIYLYQMNSALAKRRTPSRKITKLFLANGQKLK